MKLLCKQFLRLLLLLLLLVKICKPFVHLLHLRACEEEEKEETPIFWVRPWEIEPRSILLEKVE